MVQTPSHRDWVLYRASRVTNDPFFYEEFQTEIERCRTFMRSPNGPLTQMIQDLHLDLHNRKTQVLLQNTDK